MVPLFAREVWRKTYDISTFIDQNLLSLLANEKKYIFAKLARLQRFKTSTVNSA